MTSISIAVAARGNWRVLLPQLGVDAKFLINRHGPCPICSNGSDRFRWDDKEGRGSYICNQCGSGDGFDLAAKVTGKRFADLALEIEKIMNIKTNGSGPIRLSDEDEQKRREEQRKLRAMASVWTSSRVIRQDTPAGKYLLRRTGQLPGFPALRYHPEIMGGDGHSYPAMIARITDPADTGINIHITLLTANGIKASLSPAKRVMSGSLPPGSAIRLGGPAEVMGVAEGIETAISASMLTGMPVWACVNAGLMSKWVPPEIAKKIVIFADNDPNYTGHASAYALAHRLSNRAGVSVDVQFPPDGKDWNDYHMLQLSRVG